MEAPFKISEEAKVRLLGAASIRGHEPGLSVTPNATTQDSAGNVIDRVDHQHFTIGYDKPDRWRAVHSAQPLTIGGRTFWVTSDALHLLAGRSLDLVRRYDGPKVPGKIQFILVVT